VGKIATTDGDNTIFRNIPTGLYYYYIPADAKGIMNYGQYLGNNPSILSVTYSPFADNDVVTYTEVDYDNERFKDSNNTVCKCLRIVDIQAVNKTIFSEGTAIGIRTKGDITGNYDMKLETYPYRYYILTDYMNEPLLIKPQLIDNQNKLEVKIKTSPVSGKYRMSVSGYKGDTTGKLEGVNCNLTYNLPCCSSAYSEFYALNGNSFNQGITNSLIENDVSLKQNTATVNLKNSQNMQSNSLNNVTGLLGMLLSGITGNIGGVVGGAGGLANNALNRYQTQQTTNLNLNQLNESGKVKENEIISMKNAKVNDLINSPASLKTAGNDAVYNMMINDRKIDLIEYSITDPYMERIDNHFKRYGYSYNDWDTPNIRTRKYYNYIKTSVCNIASTSMIPLEYLEEIKDIFNSGITFWHKDRGARILNYNVKNEVVK
jgi:hypothetical protein